MVKQSSSAMKDPVDVSEDDQGKSITNPCYYEYHSSIAARTNSSS